MQDSVILDLKKSRYFKNISDDSLQKFLDLTKVRQFKKGETALSQNQENKNIFILMKGIFSVKVDGEFIYNLSRNGDLFGEISVISGQPSTATIEAVEDSEVVVISAKRLKTITDDYSHELHHIFYKWISQILSEKLNLTTQKAKRFEKINEQLNIDLEAARRVQQEILSSNLVLIPNFPLTVKCQFADLLGGDFYGVMEVDEGVYGILIGDVSGHGTQASLLAVSMVSYFANFSRGNFSSKTTISQINDLCQALMLGKSFSTVFYGIYDARTSELTYSYGGHHPSFILRENKVIQLPPTRGLPLGMFSSSRAKFEESTFSLKKSDRLILFTDALFECFSPKKEMLGMEGLVDLFENNSAQSSENLVNAIYDYENDFCEGNFQDDFTLMIFDQN
ncbi:MAG: SpoIIE family protein phosphatase [SAR324 cluster bacterium]|nr:SpoIIE family protein phosphatase [SAR324 cluster bacterium]